MGRWRPPTRRGRPLFGEKAGAPPYRSDRLPTQWVQSGRLRKVAGIVAGKIAPMDKGGEEEIRKLFASVGKRLSVPVWEGAPPAAALLAARGEEILLHGSAGEARLSSIFDISSLTKPLVASLFYILVQQGRLTPDGKVSEILPARSPHPARHGRPATRAISSWDVRSRRRRLRRSTACSGRSLRPPWGCGTPPTFLSPPRASARRGGSCPRGIRRSGERRRGGGSTARGPEPPGCPRTPGWDTPTSAEGGGSQAGGRFSVETIGHLGWTGCSLWIDLPREVTVVLLANRVYYGQDDERLKGLRPGVHDVVRA